MEDKEAWALFRAEDGVEQLFPHGPSFESLPFTEDLLEAAPSRSVLLSQAHPHSVASRIATRNLLAPAWVYALGHRLSRVAPSEGVSEAIAWAKTQPTPALHASALLVAYNEKVSWWVTRDDSAIKRLRVLRETMRELADPVETGEPSCPQTPTPSAAT